VAEDTERDEEEEEEEEQDVKIAQLTKELAIEMKSAKEGLKKKREGKKGK
jgi:hypothetical protein